jgi:phage shock protein C
MLAGVCGGLGKYLDMDPTLVRVLWVLFCLLFLVGVIAYVVLILVIPLEPLS